MAYPEKGATYKHEPAWLDRAKRAEGGEVDIRDQMMDPREMREQADMLNQVAAPRGSAARAAQDGDIQTYRGWKEPLRAGGLSDWRPSFSDKELAKSRRPNDIED